MRTLRLVTAVLLLVGMMAAPASAHILTVTPNGNDRVHVKWVGGPPDGEPLPEAAQGQGLMHHPAGLQPAAHGKGLNSACESNEENDSVVDIRGPAGLNCPHGE